MVLFKLFMSSGFNFGIWYTIRISSIGGGYPAFENIRFYGNNGLYSLNPAVMTHL